MAQLDVRRTYRSNKVLTAQDINAFLDDIEAFFNLVKINSDNIQDASITVSSKIIDGTITTSKIDNNAVTTAKIADNAVTTAKIADSAVTTAKIVDNAVTTAKIADSAITSAKIADNAVTNVKLAAINKTSSSTISFTTSATSPTFVTNSQISITTTGKPVMLIFHPNDLAGYLKATTDNNETSTSANQYRIKRDTASGGSFTTNVAAVQITHGGTNNQIRTVEVPAGFIHIDPVTAGTYYYRLYANAPAADINCTLVGVFTAVEL